MASTTALISGDPIHDLEMITSAASAPTEDDASPAVSEEIAPLLTAGEKPKINIFSVSYPRRKPRDQVTRLAEMEVATCSQLISWVWSGSRYSGVLCMALSSTIYFFMEAVSDIFSVQSIPLFETAFLRCTILLILSYIWLRKTAQPILGPTHVRKLLLSRALVGVLSLFSFIFCVQRIPLTQAIVLSFTTPIMASAMARIILNEKMKIVDIGGLLCSFLGMLFTFLPSLNWEGTELSSSTGGLAAKEEATDVYVSGNHHLYAALCGVLSSITAGISYCLIRAGAKASEQPVVTVLAFSVFATPAAAICTFVFQDFVLPGLHTFLLMIGLGLLAFFAEVLLARALQLEKTSKVANVQYIEVALLQLWSIGLARIGPSFGRFFGCLLILISVFCTMYFGLDKEME